jgi:hypothetical protein
MCHFSEKFCKSLLTQNNLPYILNHPKDKMETREKEFKNDYQETDKVFHPLWISCLKKKIKRGNTFEFKIWHD